MGHATWDMGRLGCLVVAVICGSCTTAATPPISRVPSPTSAVSTYRFLVGAESDDQVALVSFTPCSRPDDANCGARVERTYEVGFFPADIEGPHGVIASHDGKSFYVTIAHGRPNGYLLKYDLATGRLLADAELGMFPATVDISPVGEFLYVINFNFEDPAMNVSSLSIVDGETMTEIARPATCRMPHGSRLTADGLRHYSACMMSDLLVEVSARTFHVSRMFALAPGKEGPVAAATVESHDMPGMTHREHAGMEMSSVCSPTWAQPSTSGGVVWVACNRSNEIVEIDAATWTLRRRWSTPAAPYNIAVTPDDRLLVVTQKGPGTLSVWSASDARMLAEIKGTRGVASGVVVSDDGRYAFATLEGVGGQPGTVDVIDLATLQKVASVDVGKQAGGIALLPD